MPSLRDGIDERFVVAGAIVVAVVVALLQGGGVPATGDAEIPVTVTINATDAASGSDRVRVPVNASAFAALNATHTVTYDEYSFGYFVTGIDGLRQNDTHSWVYTVNGASPSVAVDRYTVERGDTVTFSFLPNEIAMNRTG